MGVGMVHQKRKRNTTRDEYERERSDRYVIWAVSMAARNACSPLSTCFGALWTGWRRYVPLPTPSLLWRFPLSRATTTGKRPLPLYVCITNQYLICYYQWLLYYFLYVSLQPLNCRLMGKDAVNQFCKSLFFIRLNALVSNNLLFILHVLWYNLPTTL